MRGAISSSPVVATAVALPATSSTGIFERAPRIVARGRDPRGANSRLRVPSTLHLLAEGQPICLAVFIFLISAIALGQQAEPPLHLGIGVSGLVVDSSGSPVPHAAVELKRRDGGSVETVTANSDGSFLIPLAVPGNYRLRATANGFDSAELDTTISSGRTSVRISLAVAKVSSSVVVTGSRDQMEIEKSPVAVNAVARSDFEIRNVKQPDQVLAYQEGVNVFRLKANDTTAGVGMRGFSARSQARVLVLLDGQPMNDAYQGNVSWTSLPITEVDRVEVARGPSSSLYGGNAMGGVIQMFTRPITERTVELTGQYGSYGTMLYSARFSDRIWKRMGITVSYQRTQVTGYPTSPGVYATATAATAISGPLVAMPPRLLTTTGTVRYQVGEQGNNWFNQHAFRGKADYTLSERTTATFQFIQPRYQYGYNLSISSVLDSAGNPITSGPFTFNDGGLKRITISPSLFVAGPGGQIQDLYTSSLLHTINSTNWVRIGGGITQTSDNWFSLPSGSATFSGGPGTTSESPSRVLHGEVQWNRVHSSRHRLVFGVETRQDKYKTRDYNLSDYAIRSSKNLSTKMSEGLGLMSASYAQDDVALTDRLSMVFGGRYDYWRAYAGASQSGPGVPLAPYPERTAQALSGKIALAWEGPSKTTLRVSAGNAFRAPALANLYRTSSYPPGTITIANPDLEPERMTSWEIGLRKRITEQFNVDATYFENYVKNLIYTTTDFESDPTGSTRKNVNAGKAHTRGVEFASRQRLTAWLQSSETYTWNDARISQNVYVPLSQGRRVPLVPRHVSTFSFVGDRKNWSGSVSARYVSRTFSTDTNSDIVKGTPGSYDPFFEIEATAAYRFKRFVSVFVSAQNLLDRRYYEFYLAQGRTVSVGLRFRSAGGH